MKATGSSGGRVETDLEQSKFDIILNMVDALSPLPAVQVVQDYVVGDLKR